MSSDNDATDIDSEQSDIDNPVIHEEIIVSPHVNASRQEFEKALRESQLQTQRFKDAYLELDAKYRGLRASSQKGAKRHMVNAAKTTEDQEITRLGKAYAIMVEPWVDKNIFATRPEDIDVDDPDNYGSKWLAEQQQIEELYRFIPEKFHVDITGREGLRETFMKAVGDERRTSTHSIRRIAEKLLGMDPRGVNNVEYFLGPRSSDGSFSFKAPILFENFELTDRAMFRNPLLPKILRATLFGPSSLEKKIRRSGPPAKGTIWNVSAVTMGSIAYASIIARWLFFNEEFIPKWHSDFITYKALLTKKQRLAPERMRKLLIWWDIEVFGKSDRGNVPHAQPDNDILDLNKQVEDWQVEGDSDDDNLGVGSPILSPDIILAAFPANVTPEAQSTLNHQSTSVPVQPSAIIHGQLPASTDVQPSVSSIQPPRKGGQRIRKATRK